MLRKARDIDEAYDRIRATNAEHGSPLSPKRSTIIGNAFSRVRLALSDPHLKRRQDNE